MQSTTIPAKTETKTIIIEPAKVSIILDEEEAAELYAIVGNCYGAPESMHTLYRLLGMFIDGQGGHSRIIYKGTLTREF